jgi:hypothetical protein
MSSSVTFACNIYSMVPYIGIVFVPFATIFGGRDYLTARRDADHEGARSAVRFLALSFVIVVFQVFLWGLLYIVPTLAI